MRTKDGDWGQTETCCAMRWGLPPIVIKTCLGFRIPLHPPPDGVFCAARRFPAVQMGESDAVLDGGRWCPPVPPPVYIVVMLGRTGFEQRVDDPQMPMILQIQHDWALFGLLNSRYGTMAAVRINAERHCCPRERTVCMDQSQDQQVIFGDTLGQRVTQSLVTNCIGVAMVDEHIVPHNSIG